MGWCEDIGVAKDREHGSVVVEGIEMDAGCTARDDLADEARRERDADVVPSLDSRLDIECDRELGGQVLAAQLEHPAQPRRAR